MTRFPIVPLLAAALLVSGCAPTTLGLAPNHPARPEAEAGAASDPAADLLPEAGIEEAPERAGDPDGTRENPYVGRGVVRSVAAGALVIQHGAIPGFMGAMTMSFPVAEEVETAGLEPGDAVVFRIERPESGGPRIFEVEPQPEE